MRGVALPAVAPSMSAVMLEPVNCIVSGLIRLAVEASAGCSARFRLQKGFWRAGQTQTANQMMSLCHRPSLDRGADYRVQLINHLLAGFKLGPIDSQSHDN